MANKSDIDRIEEAIADVSKHLAVNVDPAVLPERQRKRMHAAALRAGERLMALAQSLDPVASPSNVFDPGNPTDAAEVVAGRLEQVEPRPLADLRRFWGAGVYALYYRGDHPAYGRIRDRDWPIYVGMAESKRQGAATPRDQGQRLFARLSDHRKSVGKAEAYAVANDISAIRLADFAYRALVVPSAYAGAAERSVIHKYRPAWNEVLPGFGKHGDDPGTRANTRSEWDTLHPGRQWALKKGNKPNPKSREALVSAVRRHLEAATGT